MSSIGFKCSSPLSLVLGNPFDGHLSICLDVENSSCKIQADNTPGQLSISSPGKHLNDNSLNLLQNFLHANECSYTKISILFSNLKTYSLIYKSIIHNELLALFSINHLIESPLDKLTLIKWWYANTHNDHKEKIVLHDLNSIIGGMVWGMLQPSLMIQRVFLARGYKIVIFHSTSARNNISSRILPNDSKYIGSYLLSLEKSNFRQLKSITESLFTDIGQDSPPGLLLISEIENTEAERAVLTIWENDLLDKDYILSLNGEEFKTDNKILDINYLGCRKW